MSSRWANASSYVVSENHAHTWTEVYFPGYGWITFEPSANRQAPARLERPATVLSDEELARILESESREDEFCCDEEDLIDSGTFVPGLDYADEIDPHRSMAAIRVMTKANRVIDGTAQP